MRAFIFPGQGSQAVGMGAALAEASRAARDVFDEVDEALGQNLFRLMREGPDDELKLTENAQPAIMAHSIAVFRTLGVSALTRMSRASSPATALANIRRCARQVRSTSRPPPSCCKLRGQAMQQAVPVGEGAMAALLGADLALAQKIADAAAQGEVCTVANDNDPSQVVISGHKAAIDRAIEIAKDMGAKRAVPLPVSAPFHCPLMQPAAEAMRDALSYVVVAAPGGAALRQRHRRSRRPIPTRSATSWSSRSPAWSAGARASPTCSMRASTSSSRSAARCSAPMVKRIVPDAKVTSVVTIEDIEALAKEIA